MPSSGPDELQPSPGASVAGLTGQLRRSLMSLASKKFRMVEETSMGFVPTLTMVHSMTVLLPPTDWEGGVKRSRACAAELMAASTATAERILRNECMVLL